MNRLPRLIRLCSSFCQSGRRRGRAFITLSAWCVVALNVVLVPTASAQWKWRDAQGMVQYSDRPPPNGTPDKDILTRPPGNAAASARAGAKPAAPASAAASAVAAPVASGPAASAAAVADRSGEATAAARKREADAAEAKRKADEDKQAQQRVENCRRARDYVRTLESGMRVARVNDKGDREYIDDAQRAVELQRSREIVTSECR